MQGFWRSMGLAVGLAAGAAAADVCSERADMVFQSGAEAVADAEVIGLVDCTTGARHVDAGSMTASVPLQCDIAHELAAVTNRQAEFFESWTATGLAAGMSFDEVTGITGYTPSCNDTGNTFGVDYAVVVNGTPQTQAFAANYQIMPTDPFVWGIDEGTGGERDGTPEYFDSDGDNAIDTVLEAVCGELNQWWTIVLPDDNYTYSKNQFPSSMTLNSGSGRISYTPSCGQVGSFESVQVRASGPPGTTEWMRINFQVTDGTSSSSSEGGKEYSAGPSRSYDRGE